MLKTPFTVVYYLDYKVVLSKNELIGYKFPAEKHEMDIENIIHKESSFHLGDSNLNNLTTD